MSQPTEKLAVLFADICGSTALYDELGDDTARRLVSQCINILIHEVSVHHGALVKTIGDEVMCTFPTVEDAFNAACAMQRANRDNWPPGDKPVYIRVGFHYGEVIREGHDVFGDTVNTAARITSMTRAGQILTTPAVGHNLPPELKQITRHIMRTELKGKQEQIDIYLVRWEAEDMESTRIMIPAFRNPSTEIEELVLSCGEQTHCINKDKRKVMMGRGDACDLVVTTHLASRQHALIEFRAGKFVVADQSTNGTYVKFSDGHIVRVNREEVILQGKGSISLGEAHGDDTDSIIEFVTKTVAPANA